MIVGVNAHPMWSTSLPSTWFTKWVAAITGKVGMLRYDVQWKSWQPAMLTDLLALLKPANITSLLMLGDGGPQWVVPDPWAYAMQAAKIAALLPTGAILEVWNEPDQPHFWPAPADPVAYARLVWLTNNLVKQANPGVKIAAGAIAFNDTAFLNAFLAAQPAPIFDILTIHPYTTGLPPDEVANQFDSAKLAIHAAQATSLPFMISEVGFVTATVPPSGTTAIYDPVADAQSASYYRALRDIASEAGCEAICGYHLGDRAESGAGEDMALLNQDLSPRLSWGGLIGA